MSSHLCALILFVLSGVFGDTDEVKSVSVMEGDSVTLNTDVTEVQSNDQILWMFGPRDTRIAQIFKQIIDMYNSNEIFGHRLQIDSQTGSLTIRNIRSEHSGLYKLQIISDIRGTSYKRFSVTVYAHLPIPFITRNSSCSSSSCSLLCSAVNVGHVTLSWYKGNSLLSSISVSDLSISLSIHLEVEYQDKNTYSCVLNNPISNQTQHLDISELCWYCSNISTPSYFILIITIVGVLLLLLISACVFYCCCRKYSQEKQEDQKNLSEYTEIIYRLQI
ncbi:CD48 antigen-like [Chanodichthys erythropterus]|uniref:CD48 antigen-like n=1 Tax=Chanodichthys erythropterus TaxID=933992 RepID=UPI00351EC3E4